MTKSTPERSEITMATKPKPTAPKPAPEIQTPVELTTAERIAEAVIVASAFPTATNAMWSITGTALREALAAAAERGLAYFEHDDAGTTGFAYFGDSPTGEFYSTCLCGQVFHGPDADDAAKLLAAHIAGERA